MELCNRCIIETRARKGSCICFLGVKELLRDPSVVDHDSTIFQFSEYYDRVCLSCSITCVIMKSGSFMSVQFYPVDWQEAL